MEASSRSVDKASIASRARLRPASLASSALSVEMKATLALTVSWIVFLVAEPVGTLASGTTDIYTTLSLVVAIPYAAFLYFGWKRKAWAYLGSSALSTILIIAVPFSIRSEDSNLLVWYSLFSSLLLALIALESFKSYLQSKSPP